MAQNAHPISFNFTAQTNAAIVPPQLHAPVRLIHAAQHLHAPVHPINVVPQLHAPVRPIHAPIHPINAAPQLQALKVAEDKQGCDYCVAKRLPSCGNCHHFTASPCHSGIPTGKCTYEPCADLVLCPTSHSDAHVKLENA